MRGAQRSTFDEILSSGKLGLIRPATLRNRLLEYYAESDSIIDRTDARKSDFPELSYLLIPRQESDRGNILELSVDLTTEDIERIVDAVLASPLRDQVTGETNVGRFILMWATNNESERYALVSAIKSYRASLE